MEKKVKPPFIPPVKDAADIGMVDPEFTSIDVNSALGADQPPDEDQPNFDGFTYVADSVLG